MKTFYILYIVLCASGDLTSAKPYEEEKSFSDETKFNCMGSNEELNYEKNSQNPDVYKPHSKFESSDRYFKPFGYEKKRYAIDADNLDNSVEKRQVGVIYRENQPIGILQPYQRSYRFIPVKEEIDFDSVDLTQNLPISEIDKRQVQGNEETYPSILTNFKIFNKLDKKRNYDAINDDNVQELKATIRRLRSSNPQNSEQIEEELKNILDDMGLIEDDESHGQKREIKEEQTDEEIEDDETEEERSKRDQNCHESGDDNDKLSPQHTFQSGNEKQNEIKNEIFNGRSELKKRDDTETRREKREKEETGMGSQDSDLVENLKDSGDLMISGNKSPLASSEITERGAEEKEADKRSFTEGDDDYEKRVENKINSLKEEVKREIEALKRSQSNDDDDEDSQRKKRQASNTLIKEETDEVNPALHPDGELKPLVRKRRQVKVNETANVRRKREIRRRKRRTDRSSDSAKAKTYKSRHEESEEGGDLLGGDDFEERSILKRQAPNKSLDRSKFNLNKRSDFPNFHHLHTYFYDNAARLKRHNSQNLFGSKRRENRFVRSSQRKSRNRRRINENALTANRPQQLSDMSDLDLFGALPKSYDGELSRYKRVK